ncbi:superoxide dismutase family protein [Hephaestia sp. GCM10023244]|uniref:superoxide dismutase family protein n=1 Tax=unclassified Hephaestia TaxID=2631281 RepID=UPI0020771493|nr:superoxide dismutase family protein [Hephaestia sp. MAHUQ-44]MCM8731338.1 superoxide dismutase family protein [Hephaestia sp. MAHUQ-44]
MRFIATTGAAALAMALAACSGGTATTNDAALNDASLSSDLGMDNMADGNMMAAGGTAIALLKTADGKDAGTATVTAADGALNLTFNAVGLPAGAHGVHIHTTGKCDAPKFETAGGHWNPADSHHGVNNPASPKPHLGDLPNMDIAADGTGTLSATIPGATLAGLLDSDGAAFVVHADADDLKSDPAGNSGARIACGVFTAQ